MRFSRVYWLVMICYFSFFSCKKETTPIIVDSEELHSVIDKVVDIMVEDIFSPPVASRIMAYPNVAAYEIIAQYNENYKSLSGQINELKPIPKPTRIF